MSEPRRTAIVTGASQGIGAGIVKGFVERGFNVVANSRKVTQSSEVAASDRVALVDGHIGEPATAAKIVATALSRFQSIDALVNNAGLFFTKPFTDYTADDIESLIATNIERFLTHDIYLSPLEMVGDDQVQDDALWLAKGETKQVGQVKYTFIDFDRQMGEVVRVAARLRVEIGGRTVPARPVLEMNMKTGSTSRIPDYLPGGGSIQIASVDPNTGRVALEVPGLAPHGGAGDILAVEVSTKPLINLVWLGAIVMLGSAFLSVLRRAIDLRRAEARPAA